MIKLLRWLVGYVAFEAEVADITAVTGQIIHQRLRVWRVMSHGIRMTGMVRASHYRTLAKIMRKHGGSCRITRRYGLPFLLFTHRKRKGALAGAIACVMLLCYSQTRIWEIRLEDCDQETAAYLEQLLTDHGVTVGMSIARFDAWQLRTQMMIDSNVISWLSLNQSGTILEVVFSETIPIPDMAGDEPCDIVAKKAGQIVEILVANGSKTVKANEVVLAGDLLISSVEVGNSDLVHADGSVIANTVQIETKSFDLTQMEPSYSNDQYQVSGYFFGLSLPLFWQTTTTDYHSELAVYQLTLFDHQLPVSLSVQTDHLYELVEVTYTEEQARQWIEEDFASYEENLDVLAILDYTEQWEVRDGICYLTRYYRCQEDIGMKIAVSAE